MAVQEQVPVYNFPFTLQQLVVLKAYAVSQSPEEAAATLGMSKSNVSLTLKNLERTLGLELLHSQVALQPFPLQSNVEGTKLQRGSLATPG
jgi:hypothetical protein